MKPINLDLPGDVEVRGTLYEEYDLEDLDQDILEVHLPTGLTIDVGWYPEYDRNGSFRIVVYRDYWTDQQAEPIHVKHVPEVVQTIKALVARYSLAPTPQVGT